MIRHVFTCEPGWEAALADELQVTFPGGMHQQLAPGWLLSQLEPEHTITTPSVAFARQTLPSSTAVDAASVSAWSRGVSEQLIEQFAQHDGPWRLHVFNVVAEHPTAGKRRCRLIEQEILTRLQARQKRLLRTRVTDDATAWQADEALVQVGLLDPAQGNLSICLPQALHTWRRCVARFPGGIVEVASDPQAPSRAMTKLREVEVRLARDIAAGETCCDLGSSPGSWAFLAASRGATVIAVDRSPLRDDLMQHPAIQFIRGDAFTFEPPQPLDWLLSDVVAFPQRILKLLDRWLSGRWCRRFCVTIKFRGVDDYAYLADIKQFLTAVGAEYCLRRLNSNKNEVTAYGELPP